MTSKKAVNIEMLPITHRRLKMLAAEMGLTLGQTIMILLDHLRPMDINEQIKLMEESHMPGKP